LQLITNKHHNFPNPWQRVNFFQVLLFDKLRSLLRGQTACAAGESADKPFDLSVLSHTIDSFEQKMT
jgi:hypothetical protein